MVSKYAAKVVDLQMDLQVAEEQTVGMDRRVRAEIHQHAVTRSQLEQLRSKSTLALLGWAILRDLNVAFPAMSRLQKRLVRARNQLIMANLILQLRIKLRAAALYKRIRARAVTAARAATSHSAMPAVPSKLSWAQALP